MDTTKEFRKILTRKRSHYGHTEAAIDFAVDEFAKDIAIKTNAAINGSDSEKASYYLSLLSDEERLSLFASYCTHCGTKDPHFKCQCWNDE